MAKFEPLRRYATLVALVVEGVATVTDEIVDLHDRILGRIFNAAKQRHQQQFQEAGKAINDKVRLYSKIGRALLEARQSGTDAFAAIKSVMLWEAFVASVTEAQKLAPSDDFDYLHRVADMRLADDAHPGSRKGLLNLFDERRVLRRPGARDLAVPGGVLEYGLGFGERAAPRCAWRCLPEVPVSPEIGKTD